MAWVLLHMPPLTRQGENNFPLYRKRYKLFKSCTCGVKFNKHTLTHTHIWMTKLDKMRKLIRVLNARMHIAKFQTKMNYHVCQRLVTQLVDAF